MSFKNIKANNQGFTIVELLIVVVVIAILAAITIVSYNGITNRANASAAASAASAVQKKSELFVSDGPTSAYPRTLSDLTGAAAVSQASPAKTTSSSDAWYVAANSLKFTSTPATNPDATNGKDTVRYAVCGTGSGAATASTFTPTGATIYYWDFQNTQTKQIVIGTIGSYCPTTF